ncbi:DMT family transporter [Roseomonas gilardii subsp. gilardii]|uniref:DMT family transporter n=1 Tax=Roseomonas gilardii TaxID=257708 RepID=UPI001FFA5A84|nr:DMT family transporter [Roseomonas gilardii]UPG72123.1 DMT family transporter [Roseomonas gilardii subsp. gilardii]
MPDCATQPLPRPDPPTIRPAPAEEAGLAGRAARDAAVEARERRLGLFCMLGVLVCWSGFLLSGRLSTKQAFTAGDMAALRFTGSLLAGLAVVAWLGWPRLSLARGAALAFCAGFGYALPVYAGFAFAPTSHAGVMLIGTLPFITTALAVLFLGERWTRQRVLSLLVVALGIAFLAGATLGEHPGAWRGDLLFLLAGVFWSIYTLLVRRWRVPALTAVLSVALLPAPVFLPLWWLFLPSNLPAIGWGPVLWQFAYQGIIAAVMASFLYTRAVNALGAATATTITAFVPALAAIAAWPLLGEVLEPGGMAGVALVSAGIILGVLGPRKRRVARG